MSVIQVDSGTEHFIPYAKKKVRELHDYMVRSSICSFSKRIDVDSGTVIYINSLLAGGNTFIDKVRIVSGDRFYWAEQACEQPLWDIPSAVLPQMGTAIPWSPVIQHITYPYFTNDSNVYETKHQLVICRYCRRVAESTWKETSTYGSNLEIQNAVLLSYNTYTPESIPTTITAKYISRTDTTISVHYGNPEVVTVIDPASYISHTTTQVTYSVLTPRLDPTVTVALETATTPASIISNAVLVSFTSTTITYTQGGPVITIDGIYIRRTASTIYYFPPSTTRQIYTLVGAYVQGSGREDPNVPYRFIPVMIRREDTVYTLPSSEYDGVSDGDGGFSGGANYARLVSRDDTAGRVRVMPLKEGSTYSPIALQRNVIHLGEYVSNNDTDLILRDYSDSGASTTRTTSHGLIVAATSNPWGVLIPDDPEPDGSQYTLSFIPYGDPNRSAQLGSPGPVIYQGMTWAGPNNQGGSVSTPVFFFANPGWGSLTDSSTLHIVGTSGGIDYYAGGSGVVYDWDPYAHNPGVAAFAADHCAWLRRQFSRAKIIWDFIQSEMNKKRFGLLADLNELKPFATAQMDKLLVFSPTTKVDYTYNSSCYGTGVYKWETSYSMPPTIPGILLTDPVENRPIPKVTYELQPPYAYSLGQPDESALKATTVPVLSTRSPESGLLISPVGMRVFRYSIPARIPFSTPYFSFGTQITSPATADETAAQKVLREAANLAIPISGYISRTGFGLYHVKGNAPSTGLYQYDQSTNDAQMKVSCLVSGSLAYAAYSALFAPLRGAYWRKTGADVVIDQPPVVLDATYVSHLNGIVRLYFSDPSNIETAGSDAPGELHYQSHTNNPDTITLVRDPTGVGHVIISGIFNVLQRNIANTDRDPLAPS